MDDGVTFIEAQSEIRRDFENENVYSKKRVTVRSILCQATVLGWLLICSFAIIIPILTYYLVINLGTYKQVETYTCFVNSTFRVPCGKVNISESQCVNSGCCYDTPTLKCYHYVPSKYSYDLNGSTYVASRPFSPFNTKTLPTMAITIQENSADRVNIVLHQVNNKIEEHTLTKEKNYTVEKTEEKLMVEIFRPNRDLLLSTAKGPTIASENYWEWTVYLNNDHLFGIDRTLIKIKKNSTYTKIFYKNQHDHSSAPILWAYSKGKFHGLTIYHDGPMELTILPSYLILLKSLTGGTIELELTVGPSPRNLYDQQVQKRFADNQKLPYWVLQTYMCRTQGTYWNVTDLVEKSSIEDIADSFCVDENLFMAMVLQVKHDNYSGDALSESLDKYSDKKFLLSVPSQILENSTLYYKAEDLGILYKYNEITYKGKYLRQNVSFPDYSHENISQYIEYFDQFIEEHINGRVDGFILTDNWPVDEGFRMDNESFPYLTKKFQDAMSYTLQWNATSGNKLHIQKHNNYGAFQYEAFKTYYQSKYPEKIIISATKSLNQYEPTIMENIETSWTNLKQYLLNLMFASITGNQLISLPVCGDTVSFNQTFQEKLCLRWYLVAATMPLFRISSPSPYRGPADLATMFAQQSAADAVSLRNMLLPYFFSIINRNEPLIRPMFYDFYENIDTFSMAEQYMIGDKIIVAHPLTADKTKLNIYLPPKIGIWYEYWGGTVFETNYTDSYVSLTVRETDFLAFIAQGTIIPLKVGNIVDLIIAMDEKPLAEGAMQLDDISITFKANATGVEINVISQETLNITLGYIKVYHYLNDTNSLPARKDINTAIEETYTFTPYIDPPTTESTTTEESSTTPTTEPTTTTSESTTTEESSTTPTTESTTTEESSTTPTTESTTTEDSSTTPTTESTTTTTESTTTEKSSTTPTTESTTTTTESTTTEEASTTPTTELTTTEESSTTTTESTTTEESSTTPTTESTTTEKSSTTPTTESTTTTTESTTTTTESTTTTTESTTTEESSTTPTTESTTPTMESTTTEESSTTPTTESTTIKESSTTPTTQSTTTEESSTTPTTESTT